MLKFWYPRYRSNCACRQFKEGREVVGRGGVSEGGKRGKLMRRLRVQSDQATSTSKIKSFYFRFFQKNSFYFRFPKVVKTLTFSGSRQLCTGFSTLHRPLQLCTHWKTPCHTHCHTRLAASTPPTPTLRPSLFLPALGLMQSSPVSKVQFLMST